MQCLSDHDLTMKDGRQILYISSFLDQHVDRVFDAEVASKLFADRAQDALCLFLRHCRRQIGHVLPPALRANHSVLVGLPGMQRIVLEHLEHRHDNVGRFPEHSEGELGASPECTVHAGDAHPIDNIVGQSEGHLFGDAQFATLITVSLMGFKRNAQTEDTDCFEHDTEINVDNLSGIGIDHHVGHVSIANAQDMPDHGGHGNTAGVAQAH